MPFPDPMKAETEAAMGDPKVGDRYSEMMSFWMYVVALRERQILVAEGHPPCTFPDDAKWRLFDTHDDFRKAYAYKSNPGYWVRLIDRGNDVEGWADLALWNIDREGIPQE